MARKIRIDDTSVWPYGYGNASDGAYDPATGTDAPIDASCSGTSGATSLSATNASFAAGQLILIIQMRGTGAGEYEFNRIASYSAGTITTSLPLQNTYTDSGASQAQVVVFKQYSSAQIQSGRTITAKAFDGDVGGVYGYFCNGNVNINGVLSLTGKGYRSTGTNGAGNGALGMQGEGTGGAGSQSNSANGSGGGGGGGGVDAGHVEAGHGAGGGHAAAGSNGSSRNTSSGGTGGGSVGTAELLTIFMGGAGGEGGNGNSGEGRSGGAGGAIAIIIAKSFTINPSTGSIDINGNNGTSSNDNGGAGGGGAGGAFLLKCQVASLGTNRITVAKGTGGACTGSFGGNGGDGSVGRINIDYSGSITGSTTPTLNSRQDGSLADNGGMALANMILLG